MKKRDLYTTGELAKLTGVSYKTIRHYCESGLLAPEQVEENKYKKFGQAAVEQLQKILMLKYLDFSLEEIGRMLEGEEQADVLYHYVESFPGNSKGILAERTEEFRHFLEERVSPEKPFFCHKSTGAFRAFL